ncbi:MAG TPA: 50S ribosomal protein L13 [Anaerolineae bacterium]|nr:50S ribosomal protein L13 [Anaerolineae bacterium]HOQ99442.1 50S ribosomal protein L13 [Anaerolineae bacterium]HPL27747.1 50S ribosomal protein L13 [Anaerolineae bacterium]
MKTYAVKAGDIRREWYVVDAEGQTLGRLACTIATVLRGKQKAIFSPHLDVGDFVIVVNADKVRVTGQKMGQKKYYHYSGYRSGLSETSLADLMARHPDRAIRFAVKGMLPHNRLGRALIKKLHVYAGPEHPHQAQQPKTLAV